MIPFRHILCPIDFSEASARALTSAAAWAARHEARLTVLHVIAAVDERFQAVAAANAARLPAPGSRADIVDRLRASIAQSGAAGLDVVPVVQQGPVSESIVTCAEAMAADVIVMGTHGRGGFHRLLLGSVTEKVVRTATCPVLTVPPGVTGTAPRPVLFDRILCPIDYSPASLKALDCALELGRQADGCVTVLSALEYLDSESPVAPEPFDPCRQALLDDQRRREHVVARARERLHAQLSPESRRWCRVEEVVAIDRAYKAILQQASTGDVDLIVMGAQGGHAIESMLYGSNTHHVVRSATCPVLTVRA